MRILSSGGECECLDKTEGRKKVGIVDGMDPSTFYKK
jgi:hypothetical protein